MHIKNYFILGVISIALAFVTACGKSSTRSHKPLRIMVGGTMRPVIEKLAKDYTAKTGQQIEWDYGDSGELMIRIEQTQTGDLYVCHDPFVVRLNTRGLCDKAYTAASLTPVIVVAKGNPKGITGFKDLAKPGIKIILPDRMYSTTGHIVARMAEKAGLVNEFNANTVSHTRGGGQSADAVGLGTADAAIVWNAVAHLRKDKVDVVEIEPEVRPQRDIDAITTATYGKSDTDYTRVTISTLKASKNIEAARKLAEFICAPENREIWASCGFSPADPTRPTIPE